MRNNIILMGIKHCGKSTFGRKIAGDLRFRFVDIDDMIAENPAAEGLSIPDLFRIKGEKAFEKLEAMAVMELINRENPVSGLLIAPGGGIVENREAMEGLKDFGLKVFLECASVDLYSRILKKGESYMLDGDNPQNRFLEIFERRNALYHKAADIVVNIQGDTFEAALKKIEIVLEKNGYGRQ